MKPNLTKKQAVQLVEWLMETLEAISLNRMARIDAIAWYQLYSARIKRMEEENSGKAETRKQGKES